MLSLLSDSYKTDRAEKYSEDFFGENNTGFCGLQNLFPASRAYARTLNI
jgi:hypothetical protein